ncbi:MAG: hypothetical protein CL933_01595 [Deltaproteobacteria bacterium]|nr:hypothetical protein [Deltaproteobacteria bacterium]
MQEPGTAYQRFRGVAGEGAIGALCVLSALMLLTIGCTTPAPPPPPPAVVGYLVGAPDVLLIHVLPEPVIEREVRVRPDGKISVDLVGDIQAAGRAPIDIAAEIQTEISRFKRDAAVNVTVVESPSQFVTIYGEVQQPGTFPLNSETRISEAIGRVGGPRPFASLNSVRLIRSQGAKTEIIEIELGNIQNGDLSTNYIVRQGDLIVVPPTLLAKVGYAVQMLLFPLQPIISGASSAGSIYSGVSNVRDAQ